MNIIEKAKQCLQLLQKTFSILSLEKGRQALISLPDLLSGKFATLFKLFVRLSGSVPTTLSQIPRLLSAPISVMVAATSTGVQALSATLRRAPSKVGAAVSSLASSLPARVSGSLGRAGARLSNFCATHLPWSSSLSSARWKREMLQDLQTLRTPRGPSPPREAVVVRLRATFFRRWGTVGLAAYDCLAAATVMTVWVSIVSSLLTLSIPSPLEILEAFLVLLAASAVFSLCTALGNWLGLLAPVFATLT